jgi:uncharacterized protein (DUF1330 family)
VPLTLCILLSGMPGNEQLLVDYENQVLDRLSTYGARIVQRVRATDPQSAPFEVHILEFPSEDALAQYMEDPVRRSLSNLRERAIAHTDILRVDIVTSAEGRAPSPQ